MSLDKSVTKAIMHQSGYSSTIPVKANASKSKCDWLGRLSTSAQNASTFGYWDNASSSITILFPLISSFSLITNFFITVLLKFKILMINDSTQFSIPTLKKVSATIQGEDT